MSDKHSTGKETAHDGMLGDLDEDLKNHTYPATTNVLIEAYGDREVQSQGGTKSVAEVLAPIDNGTYTSAEEAQAHVLDLLRRK